jgi:hypothetical protein
MVKPYFEQMGLPLIVADSGDQPFSTGRSYNAGIAMAPDDWEVAVMLNTDTFAPLDVIQRGIDHARETGRITLPHNRTYLMKKSCYTPPDILTEKDARRAQKDTVARRSPAGVVCIPREVWDRVGGYDPAFIMWGYEDAAFLRAAGEYDRLEGPLYHYWHPAAPNGSLDFAHKQHWREVYWGKPAAVEHMVG